MGNLKELRKQNNKTQQQIAELLNIKQQTYNGYELGKTEPTINQLKILANYYKVSLDYLLDRNYVGGLNTQEYELLNMFRELNEFAQVQVIGFLKGQLTSSQNLKQKTN